MVSLTQCDKCGITGNKNKLDLDLMFHEIRADDKFPTQTGSINSRTYFVDLCDKCFQEMNKTFNLSHKKE